MRKYETVIGLEVHVELATNSKIFCSCPTEFGKNPNTHVCPVCMGMPGTLPVLNKKVVEHAIAVGLATNCQIAKECGFDRKNYFYPDNPQNYQISQLYEPICRNGYVEIKDADGQTKKVRIHEIHMEEDAGKLIHNEENNTSLVDYNRAGVPLIEIVSEPNMRNAEEVIEYLEKLRYIIQYLGASDCKMNEGSMRADVNLSVREKCVESVCNAELVNDRKTESDLNVSEEIDYSKLGTRTEMKNLNSFREITRAIASERQRQIDLIESGEKVVQETRRWDDEKGQTFAMRSKEDSNDYRYFPEPDLPTLKISQEWIDEIKNNEPEFRHERMERYISDWKMSEYDADIITQNKKIADIFESAVSGGSSPKEAANWLISETMRIMKERDMSPENVKLSGADFVKFLDLIKNNVINKTVAKEVFEAIFDGAVDPVEYVESHGLKMENNTEELEKIIDEIILENQKVVADYKNGKKQAIGVLIGKAMKVSKGKASPKIITQMLEEKCK